MAVQLTGVITVILPAKTPVDWFDYLLPGWLVLRTDCFQYFQGPRFLEWVEVQYFQDPGLLECIEVQ